MNIKEAKEEIIRTIRAYRRRDETGAFEVPPAQQRPVLLIGPPGIGKTAIMEQIAAECGIGLVSYTITHHTRQSAIGLPIIVQRRYGGREMSVTEYTMSEIVASVYDKMEQTGLTEGILFLDEINCVSETLAPTMLQFLQYKTFGTHRVPEGWLIVTAGNQPQYNRSAREFDIVTLDRVRKMEITADFPVWKEYALRAGLHGAILSYLELKPQNFYVIRTELDGRHFVTARGWEDLSRMLFAYEAMGEPLTELTAVQYLQDAEIARDFIVYYGLYRKYSEVYRVGDILSGARMPEPETVRDIPFDEKLSLIRLLSDELHKAFAARAEEEAVQEELYGRLLELREVLCGPKGPEALRQAGEEMRREQIRQEAAGQRTVGGDRTVRLALAAWEELISLTSGQPADALFPAAREWFAAREEARLARNEETSRQLTNAFAFLVQTYGTGQEIVMFLTELNADWYALSFLRSHGCEAYDRYNQLLLLRDRRESLRQDILRMHL